MVIKVLTNVNRSYFYHHTKLGNDPAKRLMMHNCVEDELGYPAPNKDKPFTAYKKVKEWNSWSDVPINWKNKMRIVFSDLADKL